MRSLDPAATIGVAVDIVFLDEIENRTRRAGRVLQQPIAIFDAEDFAHLPRVALQAWSDEAIVTTRCTPADLGGLE